MKSGSELPPSCEGIGPSQPVLVAALSKPKERRSLVSLRASRHFRAEVLAYMDCLRLGLAWVDLEAKRAGVARLERRGVARTAVVALGKKKQRCIQRQRSVLGGELGLQLADSSASLRWRLCFWVSFRSSRCLCMLLWSLLCRAGLCRRECLLCLPANATLVLSSWV